MAVYTVHGAASVSGASSAKRDSQRKMTIMSQFRSVARPKIDHIFVAAQEQFVGMVCMLRCGNGT